MAGLDFADNLTTGLMDSIDATLDGIGNLIEGTGTYVSGSAVVLFGTLFGNQYIPEWASKSVEDGNQLLTYIVQNPLDFFHGMGEGIAQEFSDNVDQKGLGYTTGAAIPFVAEIMIGTKGIGKAIKTIDKAKVVKRIDRIVAKNPLPNLKNAEIDPRKLLEYALNPEHPVGRNKAIVFESALGYNKYNADDLIKQIYNKLGESESIIAKLDSYGQRYTVDIAILGANNKINTVRTAWIVRTDSTVPELVTLMVK